MSQSTFARFPQNSIPARDHNAHAANQARKRIAELPDPYMEHANPTKEQLVGAVKPVSPAAEADDGRLDAKELAVPATALADSTRIAAATTTTAVTATNHLVTTPDTAGSNRVSEPMPPAARRSLPSRLRPLIIGLATFVVLYFIFKPELLLSQLNFLTRPKTTATPAAQAATVVPAAPTISIPKISVNAPVVYATSNDESAILTDLQSGVVHYAGTAQPGQVGNSVIFGHSSNDWWEPGNYKFVFVLLDKLVPGDTFTVNYNAHQYLYRVTGSTVVDPTDVAVLNPTPDPEMTLITCTPPGTSWKRLVVTAKQVSPAPAAATTPVTASHQGNGTLPSNAPSLNDDLAAWWRGVKNFLGGTNTQKSNPAQTTAPTTNGGTLPATQ